MRCNHSGLQKTQISPWCHRPGEERLVWWWLTLSRSITSGYVTESSSHYWVLGLNYSVRGRRVVVCQCPRYVPGTQLTPSLVRASSVTAVQASVWCVMLAAVLSRPSQSVWSWHRPSSDIQVSDEWRHFTSITTNWWNVNLSCAVKHWEDIFPAHLPRDVKGHTFVRTFKSGNRKNFLILVVSNRNRLNQFDKNRNFPYSSLP